MINGSAIQWLIQYGQEKSLPSHLLMRPSKFRMGAKISALVIVIEIDDTASEMKTNLMMLIIIGFIVLVIVSAMRVETAALAFLGLLLSS